MQEVPQVIGQNEKLESHLVGHKAMAGEPGPVEGVLAFVDPLLCCPLPDPEVHYTWGPDCPVSSRPDLSLVMKMC